MQEPRFPTQMQLLTSIHEIVMELGPPLNSMCSLGAHSDVIAIHKPEDTSAL